MKFRVGWQNSMPRPASEWMQANPFRAFAIEVLVEIDTESEHDRKFIEALAEKYGLKDTLYLTDEVFNPTTIERCLRCYVKRSHELHIKDVYEMPGDYRTLPQS